MEEQTVLPLKIDRQHGGLGLLDQPGREGLPGQLLRLACGMSGGRDPAGRKHNDRYALLQEPAGQLTGFQICLDRLPAPGKIDWQHAVMDFRKLHNVAVCENAIGTAKLFGKRQQGDPVADAKWVVGDDNQRRFGRHPDRPGAHVSTGITVRIDVEPGADHIEQLAHHTGTLAGHFGAPRVVDRQ